MFYILIFNKSLGGENEIWKMFLKVEKTNESEYIFVRIHNNKNDN